MKLKECLEMIYVACTNYDKDITGKLGTEREYEGSYEQAYDLVLEELNNRISQDELIKIGDIYKETIKKLNKKDDINRIKTLNARLEFIQELLLKELGNKEQIYMEEDTKPIKKGKIDYVFEEDGKFYVVFKEEDKE